jgi:hypothetical protein
MKNVITGIVLGVSLLVFATILAPTVGLCGAMPGGGGSWGSGSHYSTIPHIRYHRAWPSGGGSWGSGGGAQQREDDLLSSGAKKFSPPVMLKGADRPRLPFGSRRYTIPPNIHFRRR